MPRPGQRSPKEEDAEALDIRRFLTAPLYASIYAITRTNNGIDALKLLCDMGYVEHARIVLAMMVGAGIPPRAGATIILTRLNEIPYKCICSTSGHNTYIVLRTIIPGTQLHNDYCYVLEELPRGMYGIRVCSTDEIEYVYRQKLYPLLEQQPTLTPENPKPVETVIMGAPKPPEAKPEEIPIVAGGDEDEQY